MFTLGIDYGTNSVRALIVRCKDGKEFGSGVINYPSGTQGVLLDPRDHNVARQHPADYLFGLEKAVKAALAQARKRPGFSAARVVGLGVDTTGSSPIPVDAANRALAADKKWAKHLVAQCWLWKDHTSWREALNNMFSKALPVFDDLALLEIVGRSLIGRLRFGASPEELDQVPPKICGSCWPVAALQDSSLTCCNAMRAIPASRVSSQSC
jgi:ribulose kinase